ncbi:MAG: 5'/3'-nucleotidase SurE, partial [Crocinitomicaceae bacterium]|nr:5'/3'-nucleotidase SurE [Crocinitomicaceae bacterium]
MVTEQPLILITNDDGITSKGIASLYEAVKDLGEVVLIAPDSPQSGMGHAITINHPLRLYPSKLFPYIQAFACSGTPVDCVKLGIHQALKRKPDLIVSGMNHGANTATNVLYSGTMSAAVEGAMVGIPAIGFSLCSFDSDADFTAAIEIAKSIVESSLKNGIPEGVCLNVNVPNIPKEELKGVKVCRQACLHTFTPFNSSLGIFGT